jgi:two-component system, OmpR family, phosphate regulon sensor histidine kinase PhoR
MIRPMKKKSVFFIILFSSISLMILVVVQLLWMNNAFELAQDQFNHRVNLALTETVAEMERLLPEQDLCPQKQDDLPAECNLFLKVDIRLLDSLLSKYIVYNQLDTRYEYRVVKTSNDSVVFRNKEAEELDFSNPYKACLSCLYQQEIFHLELFFPFKKRFIVYEMGIWLGVSLFFLFVVIIGFSLMIYHTIRQKKISRVKDDFINNMTHEFQTPISTISLASEVLLKAAGNPDSGMISQYAKIIYDENFRLRTNVERVLQLSLIENGEIRIEKTPLDLHQLIPDTVRNLCLEHCDKEVKIQYDFRANPSIVYADVVHMTNIIGNLVDNAVKYSGEVPEIKILTQNSHNGVLINFIDNGPGIPSSRQKLVFDKFSRVSGGNVHNEKGFGIGLYYVKSMIEAHGGSITVSNESQAGSNFEIFIPAGAD